MKKRIYQKETVYIDKETGEEISQTVEKGFYEKVKSEEHFFMTYIDVIAPWFGLKPESAKAVLMWMNKNAQWNTGIVLLPQKIRNTICEELSISQQTLSNCLSALKKSKLISGEKGEFRINPKIFWKGDTASRKALLKNKAIQITFGLVDEQDYSETLDITDYEDVSE